MNPMRQIRIEKVTLNIGAGSDQSRLEKAQKLLAAITGVNPVKTFTKRRISEWGLRPGLPIGTKVTLRKSKANEILKRLLLAKENKLTLDSFDENGNIAFGIHEYINIPGVKYMPEVGIIGLEVCVSLERPGFRIKKRKIMKRKIPHRHRIKKDEAIEFMKNQFGIAVSGEE